MNKDFDEIFDIKYHIDKFEPLVNDDKKLSDENPENFALKFAALVNGSTLNKKKNRLKELLQEEHCDIFEYRLTGEKIGYGAAPAELIGDFLSTLQKTVYRLGQDIAENFPKSHIPKYIVDETTLSIQAFNPGSFRIICSGTKPDFGIFNQDPCVEDNLLTKSSEKLFSILENVKNDDELLIELEDLNPYTISAITELLKVSASAEIDIEAKWKTHSNEVQRYLERNSIMEAYKLLSTFDPEPEERTDEFIGSVVSMNSEKNYFEFKTLDNKKFKIHFDESSYKELRENKVDPLYIDKQYRVEVIKIVYVSPSGRTKEIFKFSKIKTMLD